MTARLHGRRCRDGWGGPPVEDWLKDAHGDHAIPCHVLEGAQCAGAAIYRRNVLKSPRDPECLRLEANRELVFSSAKEFAEHHVREVAECFRGRQKTEGTQGTPHTHEGDGIMEDVTALKAKHEGAVEKLEAKHAKELAALAAKKDKIIEKLTGTVDKADQLSQEVGKFVADNASVPEPVKKKVAKLVEKINAAADKHLA